MLEDECVYPLSLGFTGTVKSWLLLAHFLVRQFLAKYVRNEIGQRTNLDRNWFICIKSYFELSKAKDCFSLVRPNVNKARVFRSILQLARRN